ncbi:hypothetical protein bpuCAU1_001197 (plasmid) [Borrelia puertoricensis]|uniref:hypothetical protein n=1 Tax=Borrelia puertoricensis TaxID=2756107 RepID=UPI003EBF4628
MKKKCLLTIILLSLVSCGLSSKNKNKNSETNLLNTLDDNQKQALITFKNLLQDKKHLSILKKEQKSFLKALEANQKNSNLQDKLKKILNSEYDKNQLNKLFDELGNIKTKQFLQQLYIMLQSIKNGTLTSFSSSNFNDLNQTLEQKKEQALTYIKDQLYVDYYLYINGIQDANYFFERTMFYLNT